MTPKNVPSRLPVFRLPVFRLPVVGFAVAVLYDSAQAFLRATVAEKSSAGTQAI